MSSTKLYEFTWHCWTRASCEIFNRNRSGRNLNTITEILLAEGVYPVRVAVIGGGGHGSVVIDIIEKLPQYTLVGILDSKLPPGTLNLGYPFSAHQNPSKK